MSGFLITTKPDSVHLFADASIWASDHKTLAGVRSKIILLPRIRAALTMRGRWHAFECMEDICCERQFSDFDYLVSALPSLLRDAIARARTKVGDGVGENEVAAIGWSERSGAPKAVFVAEHDLHGSAFPRGKLFRVKHMPAPTPDDAQLNCRDLADPELDPEIDGVAYFEAMRRTRYEDALGARFVVGGFVEHALVTRDSVTTRVARRWPDKIGAAIDAHATAQITRLNPKPDRFSIEAEEMLFTDQQVDERRVITIDTDANNLNLRSIHDTLYPLPQGGSPGDEVLCVIADGVIVGSSSASAVAFDVGSWPVGVNISLVVNGIISGAGGNGGDGGAPFQDGSPGTPGGPALRTTFPIQLSVAGRLNGGAGGGGGGGGTQVSGGQKGAGGGGGGSGRIPGAGGLRGYHTGNHGAPGVFDAGGRGGNGSSGSATGGAGGNTPGEAGAGGGNGSSGSGGGGGGGGGPGAPGGQGGKSWGGAGGAAGAAINGNSLVTVTSGNSNIYGPRIG